MGNIKEELLLSVARNLVDEYISGCTYYTRHHFGNGKLVGVESIKDTPTTLPGGMTAGSNNKEPSPTPKTNEKYRDIIGDFIKSMGMSANNKSTVKCDSCGFEFSCLTDTPHSEQYFHNQLLMIHWSTILGKWRCPKCSGYKSDGVDNIWPWL